MKKKIIRTILQTISVATFSIVIICGSYYVTYKLLGENSVALTVGTALIALACISTITFASSK